MGDPDAAWIDDIVEGLPPAAEAARRRLVRRLLDADIEPSAIRDAAEADTLSALLARHEIGGNPVYTATEVAERAELDLDFVLAVRRASGLPIVAIDEYAYLEEDVDAMIDVRRLREINLSDERLLDVIRVLGRGLSQTAEAMRQLSLELVLEPGDDEEQLALRWAAIVQALLPVAVPAVERLLRLHLRHMLSSEALLADEREAGLLPNARRMGVCFADLVGFTKLGEDVPAHHLGQVADRLVQLAEHVVVKDVRFVKPIGDAVMFVSTDIDALLEAAFHLIDVGDAEGPDFPALRAGLAYGPAQNRSGDWFGRSVNRASRITSIARPGTVVGTDSVRDGASDAWEWSALPTKRLKGVSDNLRLYRAHHPDPDGREGARH